MTSRLEICVYDQQNQLYTGELEGPVELGRQDEGELPPGSAGSPRRLPSGHWRLVIARSEEVSISRRHALLEPVSPQTVQIANLSAKAPILLLNGSKLDPNRTCQESMPTVLVLGSRTVRIRSIEPELLTVQGLPEATRPPGYVMGTLSRLPPQLRQDDARNEAMIRWMQSTMGVLQSTASSSDFFEKAAQVMVELIGLDSGWVLRWEKGSWQVESCQTARKLTAKPEWQPSRQILNQILEGKRTFWEGADRLQAEAGSLRGVKVVVAAPILDNQGEVTGVLYGDRRLSAENRAITKPEAMLVEMLASSVAAGLARLTQEKAALAARVQFEQFFTPELARQLTSRPQLLEGRDCEVSVLVADISGFSRISERLGPAKTVEWINAILGALSKCVLDHQGVLVDYTGDEVMAMWGAPQEQPNHALLACSTALAMLEELPALDNVWRPVVSEGLRIGIGINSGPARVGNIGSRFKFKYGPQGNTVNLASRVQGATKFLMTRVLITGAAQAQIGDNFPTRRLCTVRVVNIAESIDLYELAPPGEPGWDQLKQGYEMALGMFEAKHFRRAASLLGGLLARNSEDGPMHTPPETDDGPSLVLMERIVRGLREGPAESHPVWQLSGK